jgi:ABC-type Na+ transport system ATPase subunit NatA
MMSPAPSRLTAEELRQIAEVTQAAVAVRENFRRELQDLRKQLQLRQVADERPEIHDGKERR